jgi:hypothetical protein
VCDATPPNFIKSTGNKTADTFADAAAGGHRAAQ